MEYYLCKAISSILVQMLFFSTHDASLVRICINIYLYILNSLYLYEFNVLNSILFQFCQKYTQVRFFAKPTHMLEESHILNAQRIFRKLSFLWDTNFSKIIFIAGVCCITSVIWLYRSKLINWVVFNVYLFFIYFHFQMFFMYHVYMRNI